MWIFRVAQWGSVPMAGGWAVHPNTSRKNKLIARMQVFVRTRPLLVPGPPAGPGSIWEGEEPRPVSQYNP